MYAPQEAIDLAMNLGYEVTISPKTGTSFEHGSRRIWSTRNGWTSADLINSRFINHLNLEDVMDALRRPL